MCGRYSVVTEQEIIEIRRIIQNISLRIIKDELTNTPYKQGEVFPADHAPVIAARWRGVVFGQQKWGFTKWDGKGVIINARSETLETVGMFAQRLRAGRCIIPAREYYEWEKTQSGKKKYRIGDTNGDILYMAGLYRDTEAGPEFVIITKDAIGEAARIHHRMPVIFRADRIEPWLTGDMPPEDIINLEYNVSIHPAAA